MRLDRALIKRQAKELIKGQILALFLISIIVGILTGSVSGVFTVFTDTFGETTDSIVEGENPFGSFIDGNDENGNSGSSGFDYFKNFNGSVRPVSTSAFDNFKSMIPSTVSSITSKIGSVLTLVMAPLSIALCGLYVMLIRGNKMSTGDNFKYVFSNTFNSTYFNKLVLTILKDLIISLMFILLIVPGFVFYYKYYFAEMIMADNPNMRAVDALKLSKEMTKGHKGELFEFDLSFIGWVLLLPFTLGLISIYVIPYYSTARALYYENFRVRCMREYSMPNTGFMTEQERANYYSQQNQYQQPYQQPASPYQAPTQPYQQPSDYYQPPAQPYQQPTEYYQPPAQPYQQPTPSYQPDVPVEQPTNPYGDGDNNNYYNSNF